MTRFKTVITLAVVLVLLGLGTAAAQKVVFKYKDVVVSGSVETDTYGINNGGWIAGDYVDSSNVQHAALINGTNVITVDKGNCETSLDANGIHFFGINNKNVAVGWCTTADFTTQIAFKYDKATKTLKPVKIKGALLVNANGINDNGDIVGTYIDSTGVQHGYLLSAGKVKNLDPPGGLTATTAFGINKAGVITIYGTDANGTLQSFTTKDKGKTYKAFHPPGEGATGTAIHHINNNGDITATYFDDSNNRHGVLWHGGKWSVLDDPNGVGSTRGNGINNKLWIVGRYAPASGSPADQGYLAKPK
jgi:hypothetical protein